MAKDQDIQATLTEMLLEAKKYFSLQKKYLRYTAAEQFTLVISKIAIILVLAIVGFVAFVFLGLAFVYWLGATIGNLALGFLLYALLLLILLIVFYCNRRKWIILPLAKLMMQTFVPQKEEDVHDGE